MTIMRISRTSLTVTLLVFILLASHHSSSCSPTSTETIWTVDEYGDFYTNNIEKAQEEIPFEIILPAYLPSNIRHLPKISGPLLSTSHGKNVEVTISYIASENQEGWIHIIEGDFPVLPPGTDDPVIKSTNIRDVVVYYSGGNELKFYWNLSGIGFDVWIGNYSLDEALAIVTSFIENG